MKIKLFSIIVVYILLCLFSLPVNAQNDNSSDKGIKLGGYLQTDNRLCLKDDNEFSWQEYRLGLKAEAKPLEKARFYSEVWLRSWGFPNVQNISDLKDKNMVSTWNLDLREAYVDFYSFLSDNLDIRIGRQRIAWGTGDKFNPTDNLNPYDLEDIWDFGRHLGSDGFKISYYPGDFTFTVVYIPLFTPSVLPRGNWASALSSPMELPHGLILGTLADTIDLPEKNLKEGSTIGIKISKNIFDFDFSLSYVHARDPLPLANKITFIPTEKHEEVDIKSQLIYPRMNIAGIDLAGAIGSIGIWAEAALFFPEKIKMITDLSSLGMGIHESVALDNKPYIKYVIGMDYTFKNGVYLNVQYLHGFIHERGAANLEDYFMFGLEWKLLDNKLKITPIAGGIEIKEFKDIKNNYAIIYSPMITYYPFDNAEITIGLRLIDGKDTTSFGRVKDYDELFFSLKYNF